MFNSIFISPIRRIVCLQHDSCLCSLSRSSIHISLRCLSHSGNSWMTQKVFFCSATVITNIWHKMPNCCILEGARRVTPPPFAPLCWSTPVDLSILAASLLASDSPTQLCVTLFLSFSLFLSRFRLLQQLYSSELYIATCQAALEEPLLAAGVTRRWPPLVGDAFVSHRHSRRDPQRRRWAAFVSYPHVSEQSVSL